mmetsp:Transcript_34309/g.105422  ORF Transcript_34309/g.105422 Transcript_34309/m.105422 type:complete len:300 (+) Transcript_34309:691-1590(+)
MRQVGQERLHVRRLVQGHGRPGVARVHGPEPRRPRRVGALDDGHRRVEPRLFVRVPRHGRRARHAAAVHAHDVHVQRQRVRLRPRQRRRVAQPLRQPLHERRQVLRAGPGRPPGRGHLGRAGRRRGPAARLPLEPRRRRHGAGQDAARRRRDVVPLRGQLFEHVRDRRGLCRRRVPRARHEKGRRRRGRRRQVRHRLGRPRAGPQHRPRRDRESAQGEEHCVRARVHRQRRRPLGPARAPDDPRDDLPGLSARGAARAVRLRRRRGRQRLRELPRRKYGRRRRRRRQEEKPGEKTAAGR